MTSQDSDNPSSSNPHPGPHSDSDPNSQSNPKSDSQAKKPTDRQSVRTTGSTDALPMAPALGASLDNAQMPLKSTWIDRRIFLTGILAVILGGLAAVVAQLLMLAINIITDICFYGGQAPIFAPEHQEGIHSSTYVLQPTTDHIGAWVIVMPIIGGLLAGFMARWGSRAIQGHGIPEAMERILEHKSNISPRVTWLKPVSSAIAIGTGGPFGAEGPIISTGGALGSLFGQLLKVTAQERKVLLAAGAAAGMAAVFGSPVAAVAMAVELLLFEFRPSSLIPVALATVVATGVRYLIHGAGAVFAMHNVAEPGGMAIFIFVMVGLIVGYASVWVTRSVYWIEDMFAKLPVHWMWWPAIGAIAAGVIGYYDPATLGVGYDNIDKLVQGHFATVGLGALFMFGILKYVSWSVSLGSGTSGGTLAPLFMIGGSAGALIAMILNGIFPSLQLNVGVAALVGMGSMFAGSARALLTAVIFCFETTRQPAVFLPLLGGCTMAYLISALTMRKSTIMTEKIVRRGIHVPGEYSADLMESLNAFDVATKKVRTLKATEPINEVLDWLDAESSSQHLPQGFPVLDENDILQGMVSRRDLIDRRGAGKQVYQAIRRPPILCYEDTTLRDAVSHMVNHNVGRLPVVRRDHPGKVVGVLSRSDVLRANAKRISERTDAKREIKIRTMLSKSFAFARSKGSEE